MFVKDIKEIRNLFGYFLIFKVVFDRLIYLNLKKEKEKISVVRKNRNYLVLGFYFSLDKLFLLSFENRLGILYVSFVI